MCGLKPCALLFVSLFLLVPHNAKAQQPSPAAPGCAASVFSNPPSEPNNLSEQQEEWLGEIVAQQFEREFHVIPDPEGRLEKLGTRLLAQLPPTAVHYRFTIVDFPINNAFSLVGGRVYVSRRLIALAQSEDDLAAVVAHEIGHGVTHQIAIDYSRDFKAVLGVTQFGDRKDVFDKWNQLVDTAAKKKYKFDQKREEQGELAADRIGLYAMRRAGYDPIHAVDFFDRVTQLKGNKGSFWTDFFHETKPESRRLREMLRNSVPLAPACVTALPAENSAQFLSWQKAVIESQFAVAKEEFPGLKTRTQLKTPLRGDLEVLQFSPDGKYLLAQDDSSIFVLSREPLATLFRIDALESYDAHFTPDSRSVVFYDRELRVQKWDIAKRERDWIHQVNIVTDCAQSSLSPSGEVLACMSPEETPHFDLQLIDVATSQAFYTHKKFYEPTRYELFVMRMAELQDQPIRLFCMRFSPDDRYVLIGRARATLAYDLKSRTELKLPARLKQMAVYSFTFLAPDELAGFELETPRKIVRARFPSGELVDSFTAPGIGELAATVKSNYLLLLHSGKYPVSVVDLGQRKIVAGSRAPALAIYDQTEAGETVGGELALMHTGDNKVLGTVVLPDSPLEAASASAFSNDGKWLALSGRTRGGIWNLESGERVFLTLGFQGALFDESRLIAQFPEKDSDPARVVKLDIPAHTTDELYKLDRDRAELSITSGPGTLFFSTLRFRSSYTRQIGELLVTVTPDFSGGSLASTLSIRDVRTNRELWQRKIPRESPQFYYSKPGRSLALVIADYDNIKAEAKEDPNLGSKLSAIESKEGKKDSYVVRTFDAVSGKSLGAILVDTGNLSFRVRGATTAGDTVLVSDSKDRTLVYSLKSGEQKGKVLGRPMAISKAGDRMLISTRNGEADLYDVAGLRSMAHFAFPVRIIRAEFADDGNSIFILTADQSVYNLKNPAAEATAAAR
jgi:hypothetical protein